MAQKLYESSLVTWKEGKIVNAFVSDNLPLSVEYLREEGWNCDSGMATKPKVVERTSASPPLTSWSRLWILPCKGLTAITP